MLGKLNCYLKRLGILLITAALIAGMVGCGGGGYNPLPSQNLEIRTWYDLDAVRDNLAGNHTLMNDLDSTIAGYEDLASPTANGGKGWNPIGSSYHRFTGSFDGQEYEICDLFINRSNEGWVGLFCIVGEGGRIKSVGVVNANVTGSLSGVWHGCDRTGILVGANLGTVNNCYSIGSVTCEWDAGGLVGENSGTVINSYYSGNVTGNASGGGLVVVNSGTVTNSYYNCDEVLINGENIITIGALFGEDFDQWLANDKFLDVNERLSEEDDYYLINDVSDFKQLLAFGQNATLKFRLKSDLDLGDEPNFYIPYLAGEFDGNGYKISNLSFNFDFVSQVGLFGYLAPGGKVNGLGVENVNINDAWYAGSLVGWNEAGTVSNCYATGIVTRNESIYDLEGYSNGRGGLVGHSNGIVSDSYFSGNVTGLGYVGGVVGINWKGTVSNSYSTGSITGTSGTTGGVVGLNWEGTVSNSYSTGTITGTSGTTGGVVGHDNEGTVSNSYSTGTITGTRVTGGVVGGNTGTVSNSYSTGNVTGNEYVGGLVGSNHGTVSDSYSTGSVTGDEYVGGLVGWNDYADVSNSYSTGSVTGTSSVGGLVGANGDIGTVSNCYSTGNVTGTSSVGGLVGANDGDVSNSFWDIETSGQSYSWGGTGKNTTEMQKIITFSDAGWNIITVALNETNPSYIWNIVNNVTYPFLSWQ